MKLFAVITIGYAIFTNEARGGGVLAATARIGGDGDDNGITFI